MVDEGMSREQIYGRRMWNLLHSAAAYYPQSPSPQDKEHARVFVATLMKEQIEYPQWGHHVDLATLNVESSLDFREWVCEQHNNVNSKLGKAAFPCDAASL